MMMIASKRLAKLSVPFVLLLKGHQLSWLSVVAFSSSDRLIVSPCTKPRILVLGSTGFVGKQIVAALDELSPELLEYRTAGRSSSCDYKIDLTSPNAEEEMTTICTNNSNGDALFDVVISTVGSLGDRNDQEINASNSYAARGAKKGGLKRFVCIGNDAAVREFCHNFGPLQPYAIGKEEAENVLRQTFPDTQHCIVQPSFIYGGDEFSLFPPRLPSQMGQVLEDVFGLYPFQAASQTLPGLLGLALLPPVSRERVAAAAVNAALGLLPEKTAELASRDEIIRAASQRPKSLLRRRNLMAGNDLGGSKSADDDETIAKLKQQVDDLGDCCGDQQCLSQAFEYLEQLEEYTTRNPAKDSTLNGRWDFCFDVEADLGTGVVKDIIAGETAFNSIFSLKTPYMIISEDNKSVNKKKITIYVETRVFGLPAEVIIETTVNPESWDPTGSNFQECFEGIKLAGCEVPIPDSWRQSRQLEFSYLDDTILIARGSGGQPHFLRRGATQSHEQTL